MSLPNLTIAVIFALIILLIPVSTVFAHRMVIEEVEDGRTGRRIGQRQP